MAGSRTGPGGKRDAVGACGCRIRFHQFHIFLKRLFSVPLKRLQRNLKMAGENQHEDSSRRKQFSLKRWVKKIFTKERRGSGDKQLRRMKQRKDMKRDGQMDGIVERFNKIPTTLSNNGMNQPQDNQNEIQSHKETIPYSKGIMINNPIVYPDPIQFKNATPLQLNDEPQSNGRNDCFNFQTSSSLIQIKSNQPNDEAPSSSNGRDDLFNQIKKLPHNPVDFLREIQSKQRLKPAMTRAIAKHLDPQFSGPIARVLAHQAGFGFDSDDSDENSNEEWK